MTLHKQLDHPTSHQLKLVVRRLFYAHDMDKATEDVSSKCDPPDAVGMTFAADVIKQARQLILVVRERATSYKTTCLVVDKRATPFGVH